MSNEAGEISVKLVAQMKELSDGLKKAQNQISSFARKSESTMKKAGAVFTRFAKTVHAGLTKATRYIKYASVALAGLGAAAVKMAMNAEESENLFKESMGRMASTARQWSEVVADALGMNAYQLRENVSMFNVMLHSMGLAEEQSFRMSKALTQLGYDMASFYNLKVDEAFTKLRAGITGEIEPMKRLGIVIDANTVKNYAYTHGLAQQGEELTEQQKILVRYNLIAEQTKKAQGDMYRTADSLTNVMRSLWSQVQLAAIKIGNALSPAVKEVARNTRDWLKDSQDDIERYAQIFVNIAGDFVHYLRTDWKAAMKAFLDTLVAMMETASTIAVDMAMRLGQGIWKAVKEGIFHGDEDEINRLARNRYENLGGKYEMKFKSAGSFGGGYYEAAKDQALWNKTLKETEQSYAMQKRRSILSGFGDNVKAYTSDLSKELDSIYDRFERSKLEREAGIAETWLDGDVWTEFADGVKAANEQLTDYMKTENELEGPDGNVAEKAKKAADTVKGYIEDIKAHMYRASRRIETSMADALDGIMSKTKSAGEAFRDFARSITDSLRMAVADMISQWFMFTALTGLGRAFGSTTAIDVANRFGNPFATTTAVEKHRGGDSGRGPLRNLPVSLFANAPRFKTGYNPLGADEYPAVLHKNEEVRQAGAGTNIHLHMHNESGVPLSMEEQGSYIDLEGTVVDIVVKNASERGQIRDMVLQVVTER